MIYIPSKEIIAFIKSFESCSLKAYCQKGDRPTIGWGNTFYKNGKPVKMGDTISQAGADDLFYDILMDFAKEVDSSVTNNLKQNQEDALLSFAYNVGSDIDADTIAEGLGDSTLLKKVNKNPLDPSIRAEFLKWVSKGSPFEKGLTLRRGAEATIYFDNIYNNHK